MISLLIFIAIIGLLVWALVTYVPMPQGFKTCITIVGILFVVLLILSAFGLLDGIRDVSVPRIRIDNP